MAADIVSELNSQSNDSPSGRKRSARRTARIAEIGQHAAKRRRERLLTHPLAVKHKRRGITQRFVELRTAGLGGIAAFLAVLGPGMLAGLSDDDPAGITTYSVLGAEHGYAVDKKINVANLRWENVDVFIGSVLTGVIGLAIAVACAATLHQADLHIEDAKDAAIALKPLAGSFATALFGFGLLGASLLAAAIVPLATAYSIAEGIGAPASLDLDARHFQFFYAAFIGLTVAAVSVISLPGLPLVPLIYASQVVNAVLLPLHVIALQVLANDRRVVGDAKLGVLANAFGWLSVVLITTCVAALAVSWF